MSVDKALLDKVEAQSGLLLDTVRTKVRLLTGRELPIFIVIADEHLKGLTVCTNLNPPKQGVVMLEQLAAHLRKTQGAEFNAKSPVILLP